MRMCTAHILVTSESAPSSVGIWPPIRDASEIALRVHVLRESAGYAARRAMGGSNVSRSAAYAQPCRSGGWGKVECVDWENGRRVRTEDGRRDASRAVRRAHRKRERREEANLGWNRSDKIIDMHVPTVLKV